MSAAAASSARPPRDTRAPLPAATLPAPRMGVHDRGDVCNAPRTGEVVRVYRDRWGTQVEIAWDEADTHGWQEDGTPVEWTNPRTSTHPITAFGGRPGAAKGGHACRLALLAPAP